MKTFLSAFLLLTAFFVGMTDPTVYLCDSKDGKKYHFKTTCRGLNSCSHTIIKTTLSRAKAQNKTVCGWER